MTGRGMPRPERDLGAGANADMAGEPEANHSRAVVLRSLPYVAVYLAAIVLANLSVERWGPRAIPYNAFLLIGLDLTTRDRLHDLWQRHRWPLMAALILAGSLLSWAVNQDAGRIAFASAVAFACAASIDAAVYAWLHRRPWLERSNASNVAGAIVDSLVFPTLAFHAFSFPVAFSLFTAKVAGALAWSLLLTRRR